MKHLLLCEHPDNADWVFSAAIKEELGLKRNYTMAQVREAPSCFTETEYIFSTWDMPSLTKEEIDRFFPSLKGVFYAAGSV